MRWYLEVPVSGQAGPIGQGVFTEAGAVRIQARPQGAVLVTPGVRYHFGSTVYATVTLRPEPEPGQLLSRHVDWHTSSAAPEPARRRPDLSGFAPGHCDSPLKRQKGNWRLPVPP